MLLADMGADRNKRGLVLDLKQSARVAALNRLVATADVLIEDSPPGVDYATLSVTFGGRAVAV